MFINFYLFYVYSFIYPLCSIIYIYSNTVSKENSGTQQSMKHYCYYGYYCYCGIMEMQQYNVIKKVSVITFNSMYNVIVIAGKILRSIWQVLRSVSKCHLAHKTEPLTIVTYQTLF